MVLIDASRLHFPSQRTIRPTPLLVASLLRPLDKKIESSTSLKDHTHKVIRGIMHTVFPYTVQTWTAGGMLPSRLPYSLEVHMFAHIDSRRPRRDNSNQALPLFPEGGVSLWIQGSIGDSSFQAHGLHDWRLVSPECRGAANAGQAASLSHLMRTVPGKRTSREQDVDWSTANSLESDGTTSHLAHIARIEGSCW